MPKNTISDTLKNHKIGEVIVLKGWVRTFRSNRFIALNDGSCQSSIQCVVDFNDFSDEKLRRITTGSSISVSGELVPSLGSGQSVELKVCLLTHLRAHET